ncbi:hypothetical protein C0993_001955 [Termitomyces sp. T159_Od127]|nr:hypothetical protein C0993_001955 [Termitomyces sp. T159_Od127]
MPPYLKTINVTIENGVDISEFLEASESITSAFDRFELSALTVVKDDVKKNIQKVRDWYEDAPDQHISTLEQLVVTEQAQTIQERKTTQGLLWLIRGFSFICKALQYSQDEPEEELTASFTKSYDETLKKHHNPIVEATFKAN